MKKFLTFFLLFNSLGVFGQTEKLRFEYILNEEARASLQGQMAEDFQGNLWGFFNSTLTKFDGYNWTKYVHNSEDPCSIPRLGRPQLSPVFADTHKNLWFGASTGLIRLDLTTYCFTTFFTAWDSMRILSICEDSSENLWLLEAKKGLIKISLK